MFSSIFRYQKPVYIIYSCYTFLCLLFDHRTSDVIAVEDDDAHINVLTYNGVKIASIQIESSDSDGKSGGLYDVSSEVISPSSREFIYSEEDLHEDYNILDNTTQLSPLQPWAASEDPTTKPTLRDNPKHVSKSSIQCIIPKTEKDSKETVSGILDHLQHLETMRSQLKHSSQSCYDISDYSSQMTPFRSFSSFRSSCSSLPSDTASPTQFASSAPSFSPVIPSNVHSPFIYNVTPFLVPVSCPLLWNLCPTSIRVWENVCAFIFDACSEIKLAGSLVKQWEESKGGNNKIIIRKEEEEEGELPSTIISLKRLELNTARESIYCEIEKQKQQLHQTHHSVSSAKTSIIGSHQTHSHDGYNSTNTYGSDAQSSSSSSSSSSSASFSSPFLCD
ncbi:hypothetical protein ADUPG1_005900 [Aduncisulcus paluster]|uniref:Uncharacterized protein n=1 Tax=Aduncisulcus paluster TaxID=2918883 RepID=A0ABQ5KFZ7_9EUKA|nr:hypothetical protein ADUPG1_005900 [Aduncisulcus paluster]